mmetsp:Transcript_36805/g.87873  ORF Transcript_36805/g.87873 Transcript_36805/m.87873 type:complete len:211 (-) Transcript_36805:248-880(-)
MLSARPRMGRSRPALRGCSMLQLTSLRTQRIPATRPTVRCGCSAASVLPAPWSSQGVRLHKLASPTTARPGRATGKLGGQRRRRTGAAPRNPRAAASPLIATKASTSSSAGQVTRRSGAVRSRARAARAATPRASLRARAISGSVSRWDATGPGPEARRRGFHKDSTARMIALVAGPFPRATGVALTGDWAALAPTLRWCRWRRDTSGSM